MAFVRVGKSLVPAVIAASISVGAVAKAADSTPDPPSLLLFAGTDLWRDGAFLHGGGLWSPAGLDADGFTLKLLLAAGGYTYPSSGLHTDVDGTLLSASVLPGWRMNFNGIILGVSAGPAIQNYRLTPYDPASSLHGLYVGGQVAADIWYEPVPTMMVAVNGTMLSIGPTGALRTALGWRSTEPFFAGPEVQAIWCADYQQLRIGAHVTGFRINGMEWSAAGGWAVESDGREGPYMRLGFSARY